MYIVSVNIQVHADKINDFIAATKANHLGTRQEPGNVRFDVMQLREDPTRFALYEVYHQESDFTAHQQTPHYAVWKEAVAPMMASPRTAERYNSLFPEPWDLASVPSL